MPTTVTLTAASGNWTVPAGITLLTSVECWGKGAAGANGGAGGGVGGGGGGYSIKNNLAVTPGQIIAYLNGAEGATTAFGTPASEYCLANAGNGQTAGSTTGAVGTTKTAGGAGAAAGTTGGGGGGGSGGASGAGGAGTAGSVADGGAGGAAGSAGGAVGGAGGNATLVGTAGTAPGGGGGGGGSLANGGAGGAPQIVVTIDLAQAQMASRVTGTRSVRSSARGRAF